MKLSDLIKESQEALEEFGDIDVVVCRDEAFVAAGLLTMHKQDLTVTMLVDSDEFVTSFNAQT
jgi:hypothetical protein